MKKHRCEKCPFREKYDSAPDSLIAKLWRWHINFCPGWKRYFNAQTPEEKALLREKYHFTKYE